MYRVLVTCPKNVRANWAREIQRFSTLKGKVTVMRRGHIGRIREFAEAMHQTDEEYYSVLIISWGLLCNAWDTLLGHIDYDLAVCDEMHGIKWHKADRTKTCMRLRDKSAARMGLTGTPIVNSALDLYSQLEFLERGLSGVGTFEAFREKYSVHMKNAEGRDVMTHVQNIPALKRRLAEVAFIVRKDEVLKDLPEKTYDIIETEMTKRQWQDYDSLASQYYLEIEEELNDAEGTAKFEMVVNNAFVKLMKLAQITSGFLNVPEERDEDGNVIQEAKQIRYSPNPKLDDLIELLKEHRVARPKEKVQVWTCFKHDVEVICATLAKAELPYVRFEGATSDKDRASAEARYNSDPDCQFWVGNAEAGGVGLNLLGYDHWEKEPKLDTNTAWVLYYSQSHKPVARWQSEERGHRKGTRVPVRVTDLAVIGSIDEDVRAKVTEKKKHALDVQDLREIMANIIQRRGERR
jgi:SNF2 family DNA or RNA helicase